MVDLKQGLEFGKPAGPRLSTYVCRLPLDPLSTTPYNNPSPPVAMFRSYQGVPCVSQPELGFAQFGATDGNFQDPSANLPPASLPPTKPLSLDLVTDQVWKTCEHTAENRFHDVILLLKQDSGRYKSTVSHKTYGNK